MSTVRELFKHFLREKRYLANLAETTLTYYEDVFNNFERSGAFETLSKDCLSQAIITIRERGVRASAVNAYIRGINPFLRWLHENGHVTESLILKPLKAEKRVLRSLSDAELRAIFKFKPQTKTEKRIHTILMVIADTGLRVNEALTLERSRIDFDNLLMSVIGKGNKERIVPFSYELRKVLFKHLKSHKFELVFCNRNGSKLRYDNVRRDLNLLKETLGIKDTGGAFHTFRRTFATNYIRSKGNPLVLQRLLGHTTLTMTNEYVKLITEDLQEEQHRTSLLNRLR